MSRGILLIISGFSGAGKGSIVKELISRHEEYALSISATTRAPRIGEEHGKSYFFLSRKEFEQMIADDALLEYATYQENYYGTPASFVREQIKTGKHMILEIDAQGAANVKRKFPEAVTIFVTAPDIKELSRRLAGRGTESQEKISGRIRLAAGEADKIPLYDYLLVNDDLDQAVSRVHEIVQCEMARTCRQTAFITQIKEELEEYLKGE